jgi:hypothetical protein
MKPLIRPLASREMRNASVSDEIASPQGSSLSYRRVSQEVLTGCSMHGVVIVVTITDFCKKLVAFLDVMEQVPASVSCNVFDTNKALIFDIQS